jgi:hypothetical protein
MELPVPNGSMQHRERKSEIDDTRIILQRASCTIAAWCAATRAAAVNLGVFLQLNLQRIAANRTLLLAERYRQR